MANNGYSPVGNLMMVPVRVMMIGYKHLKVDTNTDVAKITFLKFEC